MYLLGVSGGPDSMFLLNEYHRRNIIVAHINYNLRKSSKRDLLIVQKYCNLYNIKLEVLNIKEKPKGNIEAWARDIRYKFFKEIYKKYNCKKLLIGHHRDDFLETAIMQQRSNRNPMYFGIRKMTSRDGMKIIRPFINIYWKSQILEHLDKSKINYGIDESNDNEKFTRNKIRKELESWSIKDKKAHINWFKNANKILKKKNNKINSWYKIWKKSNFSVSTFRDIKKFKEDLVFKYVHLNFKNINLSSSKIKSIIAFIEGVNGNKIFKLSDKDLIYKKNGFIIKKQ